MRGYSNAQKAEYYKRKLAAANAKKPKAKRTSRAVVAVPGPRARVRMTSTREPWLGPALSTLGGMLGGAIGGPVGGSLGGLAGGMIGNGIRNLTGFGEYKVNKNVLLMADPPPMINKSAHGGTVIRHREYLGDIITNGSPNTFNLQNFFINPGQESTFPWLSQIAQNYEQYSLEGCVFEFRSMSSDALNSTNTALGSVVLATNYNAASPNFLSKAEMENYEFGQSCKPSCNVMHPIECKRSQTTLTEMYVRPDAVPTGQDQRMYDWGNFQIATVGFQGASVNIGELWVTYQVSLLKPKLWTALGKANLYAHYVATTGLANSTPLGTMVAVQDTLGLTFNANGLSFTFPQSQIKQAYLVTWLYAGTAAALTYPGFTLFNCGGLNCLYGSMGATYNLQIPSASTTSPGASYQLAILTNGSGTVPSIAFGAGGTLPSAPTFADVHVYQIPDSAT